MTEQVTRKDLYGYFRIGLVTGLVSMPEVIAWADEQILTGPIPCEEIIELSLSSRLSLSQMAGLLGHYQQPMSWDMPLKLLLANAWQRLEQDPGCTPGLVMSLRLLNAEERVPGLVRMDLARLDRQLKRYLRGRLPLQALTADLREFLSPFQVYVALIP